MNDEGDVTAPRDDQVGDDDSRGPKTQPGGDVEPGGLAPPYEGRTTGSDSDATTKASVERQLAGASGGGAGHTASPADEHPVSDDEVTDEEPETPLGVGESINTRGEDHAKGAGKESGREDTGTDAADRPHGNSDERDQSGV